MFPHIYQVYFFIGLSIKVCFCMLLVAKRFSWTVALTSFHLERTEGDMLLGFTYERKTWSSGMACVNMSPPELTK